MARQRRTPRVPRPTVRLDHALKRVRDVLTLEGEEDFSLAENRTILTAREMFAPVLLSSHDGIEMIAGKLFAIVWKGVTDDAKTKDLPGHAVWRVLRVTGRRATYTGGFTFEVSVVLATTAKESEG